MILNMVQRSGGYGQRDICDDISGQINQRHHLGYVKPHALYEVFLGNLTALLPDSSPRNNLHFFNSLHPLIASIGVLPMPAFPGFLSQQQIPGKNQNDTGCLSDFATIQKDINALKINMTLLM
jgi:hypothetical protein